MLNSFQLYRLLVKTISVVATTRHSRTNDLTTSKALSRLSSNEWGITRELDKKPSLHCSSIYINYMWSVLQQYVYLMSIHNASTSCPITHPHAFSLRPPCFLHVPWRQTFNLRCTCAHHVYTMRNPCPLTSSPNPTPSRLFPILLDPKSFQTALDYSSLSHDFQVTCLSLTLCPL